MATSRSCVLCTALITIVISTLYQVHLQFQLHPSNNDSLLHSPIGWSTHNAAVNEISRSISNYMQSANTQRAHTKCISISKKSHASITRSSDYKSHCHPVNVSTLSSIISINTDEHTAWIQSNMNMQQIYEQLIGHGYTLRVTPEFKHITLGGAIQGYGIESTSFKYGLLHQTCKSYQLVMLNAAATILTVDASHELFDAIAGSFNTIALITAVEIQLLSLSPPPSPSPPPQQQQHTAYYMHVRYQLILNQSSMLQTMQYLSQQADIDSMECIRIKNMEHAYILATGRIRSLTPSETANGVRMYNMSSWSHLFYYLHLFEQVIDGEQQTLVIEDEYIALQEYFFRHDLGAFWVIDDDPANWFLKRFYFMRYAFQYMLTAKHLYKYKNWQLDEVENALNDAVHDYIIPYQNVSVFLDEVVNEYFGADSILWLCPVLQEHGELSVNIGVYLTLKAKHCATWIECVNMYRELEMAAITYGGKVWYYSSSFLSREEFERYHTDNKQFEYERYKWLRAKYQIATIDLYDKVGSIGRRNHSALSHIKRTKYKYVGMPVAFKYAAWWIYHNVYMLH